MPRIWRDDGERAGDTVGEKEITVLCIVKVNRPRVYVNHVPPDST